MHIDTIQLDFEAALYLFYLSKHLKGRKEDGIIELAVEFLLECRHKKAEGFEMGFTATLNDPPVRVKAGLQQTSAPKSPDFWAQVIEYDDAALLKIDKMVAEAGCRSYSHLVKTALKNLAMAYFIEEAIQQKPVWMGPGSAEKPIFP